MVFDESEVRKIIIDCKKVLDYLAVSEVIESIEDLVQFVKDLSPFLSKVMHGYSSIHNRIRNNITLIIVHLVFVTYNYNLFDR